MSRSIACGQVLCILPQLQQNRKIPDTGYKVQASSKETSLSLQADLPFNNQHSQKLLISATTSVSAQGTHISSSLHKLSTNVCP